MVALSRMNAAAAARWLTLGAAVALLVSIAAANVLFGLALLCHALSRRGWSMPPLGLPLAAFLSGTLLSLVLSPDIRAGLPQVRKLVLFVLLALVYSTLAGTRDVRRLVLGWGAAGAATAAWGLLQFAGKWREAQRAGASFYQAYIADRITGSMSHWMTFGGELMIVLLALTALLLFAPPRRGARWGWVAVALMGTSLVLSMTRNAWLGALAGLVYLVWQWRPRWLLALPVVLLVVLVAAPAPVRARFESLYRPQGNLDSNRHRAVTWRTGVAMVQAHPWVGLGPEIVARDFAQYVPPDIPRPLPQGWYGHLHNIYLQYAAERGIPTLLALLTLVGITIRDCRRALARADGPTAALLHGTVAVVIGILVAGLFEHNLGDSEVLMLFLTVVACGYLAVRATEPAA